VALLTDETLMAYADGELDAAGRGRVEAVLARDPESRARLEIFTATGAPLAALYGKPMAEPVPPHLVALVLGRKEPRQSPARNAAHAGRQSASFMDALGVLFAWPQWSMVFAFAALVLTLGAGAGWYLHRASDSMHGLVMLERGQIFALGPLQQALESAPSGASITLSAAKGADTALTMRAALTFKNRLNAYCRQYDVTTPEGPYAGIACRNNDGQWRLEIHMAAAPRSKTGNRTTPAGASGVSDVEAAVTAVIEGDALGRTDEEALIRNRWRP